MQNRSRCHQGENVDGREQVNYGLKKESCMITLTNFHVYHKKKKSVYTTYNVKMSLATNIHCIKAEYGTWKSRKSDIKLHFQKDEEKCIMQSNNTE